jgi:hypothetical protein
MAMRAKTSKDRAGNIRKHGKIVEFARRITGVIESEKLGLSTRRTT